MKRKRFWYWYAQNNVDHDCHSIVGLTRKDCFDQIHDGNVVAEDYSKPVKCCIEYTDLFDFFQQVSGEGGGRGVGKWLAARLQKEGKL